VLAVERETCRRAAGMHWFCDQRADERGIAGRLVDGPPEATALLDFPYAGSTGASCSSTKLATGDGHRRTGHVPGRSPLIAASYLAFPRRGSYRRICRALFGSASEKSRPSGLPMDLTNLQALLNHQKASSSSELTSHHSHSGCQAPVTATLRTDWGPRPLSGQEHFVSLRQNKGQRRYRCAKQLGRLLEHMRGLVLEPVHQKP
jgi:hypothetical protein